MITPMIVGRGVMVATAVGGFVAVGMTSVGDAVAVWVEDAVGDGMDVGVSATTAGILVVTCMEASVIVRRTG